MKYISMMMMMTIYAIIISLFSASSSKIGIKQPKFCIDCKFYTNSIFGSIFGSSEFGKCLKYPKN